MMYFITACGGLPVRFLQRVDLHRMEWLLLETVEWRIRVPNAFTFLRQYHTVLVHHRLLPEDLVYATLFKGCAEFMAVSRPVEMLGVRYS